MLELNRCRLCPHSRKYECCTSHVGQVTQKARRDEQHRQSEKHKTDRACIIASHENADEVCKSERRPTRIPTEQTAEEKNDGTAAKLLVANYVGIIQCGIERAVVRGVNVLAHSEAKIRRRSQTAENNEPSAT